MTLAVWACVWACACVAESPGRHAARGIVIRSDPAHRLLDVSCDEIPGYMAAMDMEFALRREQDGAGLKPGTRIEFTVVEEGKKVFAEEVRQQTGAVFEPEPMAANGLNALNRALHPEAAQAVLEGQLVPDFALTDQSGARVSLSDLRGKVVALTFGYSRCPNPTYCYRLSNNLEQVSKRMRARMGRDLVLLTIAIDPEHDRGQALQVYADEFHADVRSWHFLTGPVPEIHRVAGNFGMNFWENEGLLTHTLHTAVLDREGRLVANLEGNQFSVQQLTDLVRGVLER